MIAQETGEGAWPGAFDALIVDGNRLSGAQALRHFEAARAAGGKRAEWMKEVQEVVEALMLSQDGGLLAATSGTTGPPKRMRIPRISLVNSARLTAEAFGLRAGDRALLCLPCTYIAGKMMLVRAMVLGLDLHAIDPQGSILEKLDPSERFRFTAMVPLQLHRALREDRRRVEEQFDAILLGGGPVSRQLEDDLCGLRTQVFQGYGSTETVTHVALRRINGAQASSHYTALGEVTFALEERGCLVVRTPHLLAREQVTNDLAELIDDRHFRWLGRIDHVILSGGKKIHPEELEARTAGVIPFPHYFTATPDDRLGQAVTLVVEADRELDQVRAEVMEALQGVLAAHELPRRIVAVRELRRTSSGKVLR